MHNPSTRGCYCTPRLRECAAIRPSADNAATCAKLRIRLVSRTRKYHHITPVLQHLYWLPICVRPTYKVLLFAYSLMHDQAPCYLAELLSRRQPNRRLRSASLPLLTLPASQAVTHGDRCFAVAAAALWNGLPDSVGGGGILKGGPQLADRAEMADHIHKDATDRYAPCLRALLLFARPIVNIEYRNRRILRLQPSFGVL